RGGFASRRFHRRQERDSADRCGDSVEPARNHDARAGVTDAARGARAAYAFRHRHEHRPHAGRGRSTVLGDPRTHPPDRGKGAAKAKPPRWVGEASHFLEYWPPRHPGDGGVPVLLQQTAGLTPPFASALLLLPRQSLALGMRELLEL